MFYLEFADGKAPIVIPNGFARIRLGSNSTCRVRIDWQTHSNADFQLGYDHGAQGMAIPEGEKFAVIRRLDESTEAVVCCYST